MSPQVPPGASPRPMLRRAALLLGVFLAFLAAGAGGVRKLVPMASHYYLDEKARYFFQHKDEFDLVFVGSSATFRNYVPKVVDAELAKQGLHVRSFNFGVLGFRSFETDYLIRWILDQEPRRLKWLVIEPPAFADQSLVKEVLPKEVGIHTPAATVRMLRSIWRSREERPKKAAQLWDHAKRGFMNALNVGRGPHALTQHLANAKAWDPPSWLAEGAGFEAVEERPTFVKPVPNPLGTRAQYGAKTELVVRENLRRVNLSTYNREALRSQIETIRARGVEPIYCLSPMFTNMGFCSELYREGLLPNLLTFQSPAKYPFLFAYDERVDEAHFYRPGAERYSRFVAPKLAEIMKSTAP